MQPLFSVSQIREADQYSIHEVGLPEMVLMEHAGIAVVRRLRRKYHHNFAKTKGVILVGSGNNGGDALVVARVLYQRWCRQIQIVLIGNEDHMSHSASLQLAIIEKLGIKWGRGMTTDLLLGCDWIVDGILGTGLRRSLEGSLKATVEMVNQLAVNKWVVAIDIPSGLCAETGKPLGAAIKASETITLGFIKKGLVTGKAADYVGNLILRNIQIPRMIPSIKPEAFLYGWEDTIHLPPRKPSGHKGDYGHVYVLGGTPETQGAAMLSCLGAMRSGAGLVTLVAKSADLKELRSRMPIEVMTTEWSADFFSRHKGTAIGVGPGLGMSAQSWDLIKTVLHGDWPVVLDADALTLLSENSNEAKALLWARRDFVTVLTPHPKEAARLLGITVEQVQDNRYEACRNLVNLWGVYVVLKGTGTLIGAPRRPQIVVLAGDPGLSKGGSGDVLTGVLVSLLGQGMEPIRALPLGVYIHGRASEILTQCRGQTVSSMAGEIADLLPKVLSEITWRKRASHHLKT